MATNSFKIFDENAENLMSQEEYAAHQQRANGVVSGIANSVLQNRVLHQLSYAAYALGQLMVLNGFDATDDEAVDNFATKMSETILQKVADKATSAEATAGTNASKYITPATLKAAIAATALTSLSGILSVSKGGTGAATFTTNYPLFGNGTGTVQALAPLTAMARLGDGYGTCATAAATTAKVVTLANFVRRTGSRVSVYFTYAVPASATMNVNSTGAATIRYKGSAITAGMIPAGAVADFVFDGTYWQLVGTTNAPMNIATGSYTGVDGTSRTLTFGFKPKLLVITGVTSSGTGVSNAITAQCDSVYARSYGSSDYPVALSVSSTGITLSNSTYVGYLDKSGYTYSYVAIG